MAEARRYSLVKPTANTPFHIDFDWWQSHDNNWRVHLHDVLCEEHQQTFNSGAEGEEIDWIDPETAEIKRVDGLQQILMVHCARQPDFLTVNTKLVDSVFRALLANNNQPLTPAELSERIGKSPETITRTLSGPVVYMGIRPVRS